MDYLINYPIYILFGVLPSILWLSFYLRKDVRPEPRSMILKVFFLGMLATLPALFLETVIFKEILKLNFSSFLVFISYTFLGVALIEESLKFLVVKEKVLRNPEFDEPIDAMIYMIIAALGFAAGENILILLPLNPPVLSQILGISFLRFLGATFLHALCSAIVGFFLGLSFFNKEKRGKLVFIGLTLAIFLHGFYNFSIMGIEEGFKFFLPSVLLIILAILVSFGFKRLKKLKKSGVNVQI